MTNAKKGGLSLGWLLPFFIVALIFAGYSVYWFYMRGELEKSVRSWIDAERAAGATVEYQSLDLRGYPYRFALHVDQPVYGDGRSTVWSAETLQLIVQPWNWNHMIARSPGQSTLDLGGVRFRAALGPKSAGSLSWNEDGLRRLSLALDEARLVNEDGEALTASGFEFHARPPADDPNALQIVLQWEALTLPAVPADVDFLGQGLQPSRLLIEVPEAYPVIASGGNLRDWVNRGGSINIAQLLLNWGPLNFGATADLSLDSAGYVDGGVDVRIDNSDDLKAAISGSELAATMDGEQLAGLLNGVSILGEVSKDGGFLPLSVRDGQIRYLGQELPGGIAIPPVPLD